MPIGDDSLTVIQRNWFHEEPHYTDMLISTELSVEEEQRRSIILKLYYNAIVQNNSEKLLHELIDAAMEIGFENGQYSMKLYNGY